MRKSLFALFFLASLAFTSCDEDEIMPSYTQDLAELFTDAHGNARKLIFDDGREMSVVNHFGNLTPDTIYRIRALYLPSEKGVQLTAAQSVYSSFPVEIDVNIMQTDPVELKSWWSCPRYINMSLGLKTGGGSQMIGFRDNGIEEFPSGIKKKSITLFHDQIEDPAYYTQDVYLSCPIYHLEDKLKRGRDSVEMIIHTFKGVRKKSFLY